MKDKLELLGNRRILVALSGGADSTALLYALHELKETTGIPEFIACGHYNHHLRAEADMEQGHVETVCKHLCVKLITGGAMVAEIARERKKGLEETARHLRYEFLERAATELNCVLATAHNANDNAETLLLNLARGTGAAGLCGIPLRRGIVIRPMLSIERSEIISYLRERGISHVEDESNKDITFRRNLVRHKIVPILRQINPSFIQAACRTACFITSDEEYLMGLAQEAYERHVSHNFGGVSFPADEFKLLHPAIQSRLCRLLSCAQLNHSHIEAIIKLAENENPHALIDLPCKIKAGRIYGSIWFGRAAQKVPQYQLSVKEVERTYKINNSFNSFLINSDTISGTLRIRPRKSGDYMRLKAGRRTLKKLYIDKKIPCRLREAWPVVVDDNGIIAVLGIGADIGRLPIENCRTALITIDVAL